MTYLTQTAAAEALIAEGFAQNERGYFTKRTFIENWEGRRPVTAICEIKHNHVDPEYNSPDFYTVRFL